MLTLVVSFIGFVSCDSDDNNDNGGVDNGGNNGSGDKDKVENVLSGSVTGTKTLDASIEYKLTGPLLVEDGGVLEIPAGTVIKAEKGFSKYILVLQGGKIFVKGTAEKPVVMKGDDDNAKAGHWGGLVINGKAPLTSPDEKGSTEINSAYIYGGNVPNDNSGEISYLILGHTGARSSADVEHNGLTLNGVGNGTKISNIYVYEGADDAIEFFGGTVNVSNLLAVNPDDDMFDFTQGYTGTLKNCYGIWEKGYVSSEDDPRGVEADGNLDGKFGANPNQSNINIENMTIDLRLDAVSGDELTREKAPYKYMHDVIKIRRGSNANIKNALVKGTGTVKDLIDVSDGKGNGDTAAKISLTNALSTPIFGKPVNTDKTMTPADYPGVKVEDGNTGCPTDIFSWTGYKF